MDESIFKAYDIRGQVPDELNPAAARAIGAALGAWLPQAGPVAVGRDMRPSSQELTNALVAGLTSSGRAVWDLGQVTTEMLYFAVAERNLAGGAMVTASHNPGEDNGIKLFRDAARAIGAESGLGEIKQLAQKKLKPQSAQSAIKTQVETHDITKEWGTHVLSFVDTKKLEGLKVAVDAGNGMAGTVITSLQPRLPFEVVPLYFEPDGSFPNHPANPLIDSTLAELKRVVKAEGCDAGVAFDGDGDRAVFVDEKGETVTPSVLIALLSAHFLQLEPGSAIVHDRVCSRIVPETIQAHGGEAIPSRVGHAFMEERLRANQAPFGGEHAAHYYFRDNHYADSALIATLLTLELMSTSSKSLSELVAPYRKYYVSGELNFKTSDHLGKLALLSEKFADGEQDSLDGLSVAYPEWWFNVRASNTEPLLRLNVEAESQELLTAKTTELKALIEA